MIKSLKTIVAAAALFLGLAASPAQANVIQTFNASGVFTDNSVLSGTLTFDLTLGVMTASNLIVTGPRNFIFVNIVNQSYTQAPGDYNVGDRNAAGTEDFDFDLPNPAKTPLFNYQGGPFCSRSALCVMGRNAALFDLTTSTSGAALVVGALNPIPEPTTLALLGTVLLGLGLTARRHLTQASSPRA